MAGYRRGLARSGWLFVIVGAINLILVGVSLAMSDSDYGSNAVIAASFGAIGVSSLFAGRSLDSAANATTISKSHTDTATGE